MDGLMDFGAADAADLASAESELKAAQDALLLADAAHALARREAWRAADCRLLAEPTRALAAARMRLHDAKARVEQIRRWSR